MMAEPTEEQLRAYEEELSRITSTQMLLQTTASLLSVGGRRLGLAEGSEHERDLDQVCDAIDGARALLPIVERRMPAGQLRPLRDALSQLQMAYARAVQEAGAASAAVRSGAGSAEVGGDAGTAADGNGGAGSSQAGDRAREGGSQETPAGAGTPEDGSGGTSQGSQPGAEKERGPGPAESSGRLWVPGR